MSNRTSRKAQHSGHIAAVADGTQQVRTTAPACAPHNQKRTFNLAALVALALAALLAVCGTAAFTVSTAPADNVITFGSVKVRVCEFTLNSQGEEVPFVASAQGDYPSTRVTSGNISRIVRVQNAGDQPEYVRARLVLRSVSPEGQVQDASAAAVLAVNDAAGGPWVDGGDGWYYYRGTQAAGGVVAPGASTENLMDSLRFVGDYHAAAQGGTFQLQVDAQAVQAKNQQTGQGALDVLDVQGWPEAR